MPTNCSSCHPTSRQYDDDHGKTSWYRYLSYGVACSKRNHEIERAGLKERREKKKRKEKKEIPEAMAGNIGEPRERGEALQLLLMPPHSL